MVKADAQQKTDTHEPSQTEDPTRSGIYAEGGDQVLAYAWELYETYSSGSSNQKKQNSTVRRWVIILIFLTSTLAVFSTLPGMEFVHALFLALTDRFVSSAAANFFVSNGRFILSAVLIVLSVATTAVLSYAAQFTPLKAWIMYRVGADRIRTEIYLYRMGAGQYKGMAPGTKETRDEFLKHVEAINRQIYELETAPPFLQLLGKNQTINPAPSWPRKWGRRLRFPFYALFVYPLKFLRSLPGRFGNQEQQEEKPITRKPGRYYYQHDNGFNKLSGEDYLNYRAIPQRDWYVKKVYEDYEKIKDWRIVLLTIGGVSAVLAAVQREPYIVITTAAAIAINTHLQLNLIGGTYGNYHITASKLDSEIVRWRNVENRESPEELSRFVSTIEQILEEERVIWMQQASQAQQETEQTLIKGAGKREGIPSFDESTLQQTSHVPSPSDGGGAAPPAPAPTKTSEVKAISNKTD